MSVQGTDMQGFAEAYLPLPEAAEQLEGGCPEGGAGPGARCRPYQPRPGHRSWFSRMPGLGDHALRSGPTQQGASCQRPSVPPTPTPRSAPRAQQGQEWSRQRGICQQKFFRGPNASFFRRGYKVSGATDAGPGHRESMTVMMELHEEVLQDMVPPKKHLLRHQPANAQMGLIKENMFCTTLQLRLFTMDLNVVEHKITALSVLVACNYLLQSRKKIIAVLFKALNSTNSEL
ncbi:unnamed protein product [Rangifer tarandus platyrhynchus]|uniref:Uncharacterized protein n=2 Tax=Rangifer tarandus platyrhynchus TaxID=3082113 RepID=A0ACB0E668_RANTA|nr:unnamed protein product [Rangifer tarandus platyrhynchus]CAI9696082.1 unnamed protein product [Rangifer tarandus platyrhynchus]